MAYKSGRRGQYHARGDREDYAIYWDGSSFLMLAPDGKERKKAKILSDVTK